LHTVRRAADVDINFVIAKALRSITLVTITSRWHCTQIAHEMATIAKLKSGNYRVQIRRKGQYASKTFSKKSDALSWSF